MQLQSLEAINNVSTFQTYVNISAKGLYQYILVVAFERCMLGLEISLFYFKTDFLYVFRAYFSIRPFKLGLILCLLGTSPATRVSHLQR